MLAFRADFLVPERLSDFARYFIADLGRRKELDVPVLIWDTPAISTSRGQTLDLTRTGSFPGELPTEPVVLPLRKGASRTNAFAMGVTVGRTDNNDIVVDDSSVSRFHAYFSRTRAPSTWKLVDAESKNGTWVGPLKLEPNGSAGGADRARLRFGDVEMTYLTAGELLPPRGADAQDHRVSAATARTGSPARAR